MAATRERRSNAGGNMASLIKDFHEEETFTTLYGGFDEEVNDNDFDEEEVSDDGSDVDFEEVDEDNEDEVQDAGQDDEEGKRKRRKPTKAFSAVKRKITFPPLEPVKKVKSASATPVESEENSRDYDELSTTDEEETPSTSDREDSRDAALDFITPVKKKTAAVSISSRSIRDSTAAKRFETEELEMVRAQRRQEIGPRKKVKHHVPTQKERLAKSIHTEKKNRADLERHERDEEENEKKKSRKPKRIRGPFASCFISTTQIALTDDDLLQHGNNLPPLEGMEELETPVEDPSFRKRHSRNLLAFKEDVFEEAFASWKSKRSLPEPHACVVTGRPARYLDPVTLQYYHDVEALKALHNVIYRHFLSNPMNMSNDRVMEFIEWYEDKYNVHTRGDHSQVGTYDYSPNAVVNNNGTSNTVTDANGNGEPGSSNGSSSSAV
ncbi:hypothetical protein BV898_13258 [Hypsibius exemplaris]|uniref:Vacuolar protein sorting-associated protein 72 homolog n=1 Tax=Hypsibius exemplaris TaxID=2072580 RepID=A0A1W0WBA5_HYPEX|nr:hypothetical protein BV898_13258 [Hypsibius exemplaris]